jgi:hypothetical protein
MEAKRGLVRPRLVLFGPGEMPGNEVVYEHTYIILRFRHGMELVLNLTGYQFGYKRYLYTLRKFEKVMLGGKAESGEVVDFRAEIKRMVEIATGGGKMFVMEGDEEIEVGSGEGRQMRATELLDLSFDDGFLYN